MPLGTQSAEMLDARFYDEDPDGRLADDEGDEGDEAADPNGMNGLRTEADYRARAAKAYEAYIRGFFVTAVPEPETWAPIAAGMV